MISMLAHAGFWSLSFTLVCSGVATAQEVPPSGKLAPPSRTGVADEADLNERATPEVKAVRRAENSVVSIYVLTRDQRQAMMRGSNLEGQGSGVILDQNGMVITNWHVVASAAMRPDSHQIQVRLRNRKDYGARILNVSRDNDLALLQLELPAGEEVQPVAIGDSDSLMVGETVIAIGNPQGHANTVTRGVLSATERDIAARTPDGGVMQLKGLLQTDAAINQGNSGGALLDITGKLIGVNNAMAANAENIGFAIPVNTVQRVFNELLIGSTNYASWLGMRLDEKDGALTVGAVDAIGPAAQAGLQVGDQVIAAGDKRVASAVDYARALVGAEPGRAFALSVRRGNRELTLKPVPQPRAAGTIATAIGAQVEEVREDARLLREASDAFSDKLMRRYRLAVVVRLTHVAESSPAAALGLQASDVLLYWQQRGAFGGGRQAFDGIESLAQLLTLARGQDVMVAILRNGEVLQGPLSVR